MHIPFKINILKTKTRKKGEALTRGKLLTKIFAVLAFLGIDAILPCISYWLFQILNPAGFWQILVSIIIGFFIFIMEVFIVVISTLLLIYF